MNLSYTPHGTFGVARVEENRLDASIAIQFKDAFRSATAAGGDVILDLNAVDFLDSSGLGAIVAVYKGLGPGRHMALAGLRPPVDKVMTLTRMNSVFAIFPTVEQAIAAASQTAAE